MTDKYCAGCGEKLNEADLLNSFKWCKNCLEDGEIVDANEGTN